MTDNQKQTIIEMRKEGYKLRDIAMEVNTSYEAVKSFCKRNHIVPGFNACRQCGMPVTGSMKKFCSVSCRNKYWKIHKSESYKGNFHFVCAHCHKEFVRQRNYHPKYCSHQCYISARYHKEEQNG